MTLINSKREGLLVRRGGELFKKRSTWMLSGPEEACGGESKWALLTSRPCSDLSASSPVWDLNLPELPGAAAADGLDGSPVSVHKEHGVRDGRQVNLGGLGSPPWAPVDLARPRIIQTPLVARDRNQQGLC